MLKRKKSYSLGGGGRLDGGVAAGDGGLGRGDLSGEDGGTDHESSHFVFEGVCAKVEMRLTRSPCV